MCSIILRKRIYDGSSMRACLSGIVSLTRLPKTDCMLYRCHETPIEARSLLALPPFLGRNKFNPASENKGGNTSSLGYVTNPDHIIHACPILVDDPRPGAFILLSCGFFGFTDAVSSHCWTSALFRIHSF